MSKDRQLERCQQLLNVPRVAAELPWGFSLLKQAQPADPLQGLLLDVLQFRRADLFQPQRYILTAFFTMSGESCD